MSSLVGHDLTPSLIARQALSSGRSSPLKLSVGTEDSIKLDARRSVRISGTLK